MKSDVTVVIPTIPPRMNNLLLVAVASVGSQELPAAAISIAVDTEKRGAWHTRQRAVDGVQTAWLAFLDDDDWFYPQHLAHLRAHADDVHADFVFSYFDTSKSADVLGYFGRPFNPAAPHHTTMTVMVRTELAKSVRFTPREPHHEAGGEDWRFILGCVEAGAKIVHLPEMTWVWRHHSTNTSGREDRW